VFIKIKIADGLSLILNFFLHSLNRKFREILLQFLVNLWKILLFFFTKFSIVFASLRKKNFVFWKPYYESISDSHGNYKILP